MLWIFIFIMLFILAIDEYRPIKFLHHKTRYLEVNHLFWLFGFLLIILAGFRGDYGYDKQNYIEVYYNTKNVTDVFQSYMEPGYVFIGYILSSLKLPIEIFFLFIAFLSIFIKLLFANYFMPNKKFLFLFYYFSLYYFTLDNAQIRYGVAIAFMLVSIKFAYEKKLTLFIGTILVGASFHIVSIAFLPMYIIINYIKMNKKMMLIIIIGSFFLYLVDFLTIFTVMNDLFLHNEGLRVKLIEYHQERQGIMNVSYLLRIGFLLIFYYFYAKKLYNKGNNLFFMTYLYGFVLYMVFNTVPILAIRASSVPRILEVSMISTNKNRIGKRKVRIQQLLLLVILVYCTLKFTGYMMDPVYFNYSMFFH